mgnify:CR=1 FL=1
MAEPPEGNRGSRTTGQALAAALAKAISAGTGNQEELQALYNMRDMFGQKSVWAFGGDGWAYDIGYGGVDHVLASGENINILVLDTEVYSNTGGQASKATNTGAVAQFAAAGKAVQKKDLAAIAMQYGNVYVARWPWARITARPCGRCWRPSPILVPLSSSPMHCISHGIKIGMNNTMLEMKAAVQAGYWHLFRYDPRRKEKGETPSSWILRHPLWTTRSSSPERSVIPPFSSPSRNGPQSSLPGRRRRRRRNMRVW